MRSTHNFSSSGNGPFETPSIDCISSHRVVVATCMMAAKLHNLGLQEGHFDVVSAHIADIDDD